MKVLHVTPWYEPAWASGGTAVAVSNLCAELVEQGVDVTVLTTTDAGAGAKLADHSFEEVRLGVRVRYSKCGVAGILYRQGALSFGLVRDIFRLGRDYDVIHVHSTRNIYGLAVMLAAAVYRKPYVVTPHASITSHWMEEVGRLTFIKKAYAFLVDRFVLARADRLHFLTEHERECSVDWSFNRRDFILPNGLRQPVSNAFVGIEPVSRKPLKLLHVGRIHPQKNTANLIHAVVALGPAVATLDIIGPISDQSYYDECLDIIAASSAGNIVFLGEKSFAEVQDSYSGYDLFCMPSMVEGVSMALIEAASHGLPCLVSKNVGNWREIHEDKAGEVCGTETESIERNLQALFFDRLRLGELAVNAKASIGDRYNLSKVVLKLRLEYEGICR